MEEKWRQGGSSPEASKHMTVYEARVVAWDKGQALSAIFSGRHMALDRKLCPEDGL